MVAETATQRSGNVRHQQSASSQAFLVAVLLSSLFSLTLNLYLSAKLGMLKDLKSLESDLMHSFTQGRLDPNNVVLSAAEAHGLEAYHAGDGVPHPQGIPQLNNHDAAAAIPPAQQQLQKQKQQKSGHKLSGLQCDKFGGPSPEAAQEMVYWEDIPSDSKYVSPFKQTEFKQYLSFEPDDGGWNNIRMNMETVLAMAFAMGRVLVLPPEKEFYLLGKSVAEHGGEQKNTFSFSHFFHMESIHDEHVGFDIISMTEYLETVAMKGLMINRFTQKVAFPPNNRTNWDGASGKELKILYGYLRDSSHSAIWPPEDCLAAFPKSRNVADAAALQATMEEMLRGGTPSYEEFVGKPVDVDASTLDRMRENWAGRKKLCIYNNILQQQDSIHMPTDHTLNARLLVHFYAFLFFQDWKQDLWMKRFVRDHVRYIDEIQCAAARVVEAVRKRAKHGVFDSFHVRRGDFQYKDTRVDASEMYRIAKDKLTEGDTVFIATDERDKSFFNPLKEHYDVVFLDDFLDAMGRNVNTNYYGMIDQLVASRSRVFFGCWFSTFTGYINRLRGYHADDHQEPGYGLGIVNSYYYAMADRFDHMRTYYPVKREFFAREFPTSWRLIDTGVEDTA